MSPLVEQAVVVAHVDWRDLFEQPLKEADYFYLFV
jgi:hypothetical protein